jgi:hypothetical protein
LEVYFGTKNKTFRNGSRHCQKNGKQFFFSQGLDGHVGGSPSCLFG